MSEQNEKPELVDGEKYRISSKTGVLSVLRLMIRNKSLATCYFRDGGSFFPTVILSLDTQRNEMVLDYGPDERLNRQALKCDKWTVVSFPDNVKVEFSCRQIGKVEFEGRNAFLTQIPDSLLRIQKREYYRIVTPTIPPVKCLMQLQEQELSSTIEVKELSPTIEVILKNISYGGMAVTDPQRRGNFKEGSVYENCRIILPGIGTANVNIRILRVAQVDASPASDFSRQHVGCQFIDTGENMLSLIQRYIIKLELERKRTQ